MLGAILDPKTSLAWSLDEFEEGLSHNWRVPNEWVDGGSYSTDAIIDPELRFDRVGMLERGQQIKSLISGELRSGIVRKAGERRRERGFRLHQKLVRWSSQLYAVWLDVRPPLEMVEGDTKEVEEEGLWERAKALLTDLEGISVSPTQVDMLEWLQLLLDQSTNPQNPLQHDENGANTDRLLSPLSMRELSELRSMGSHDSSILFDTSEDIRDTVTQLGSTLKARIATLHRMDLLSQTSFTPSRDKVESPHAEVNELDAPVRSTRGIVAPPQPQLAARDEQVAELHAKMDSLTKKVDALIESQSSAHNAKPRPVGRRDAEATAAPSEEDVLHPVTAVEREVVNTFPQPIGLQNIETTPSPIVILLSIALFLALIRSSTL